VEEEDDEEDEGNEEEEEEQNEGQKITLEEAAKKMFRITFADTLTLSETAHCKPLLEKYPYLGAGCRRRQNPASALRLQWRRDALAAGYGAADKCAPALKPRASVCSAALLCTASAAGFGTWRSLLTRHPPPHAVRARCAYRAGDDLGHEPSGGSSKRRRQEEPRTGQARRRSSSGRHHTEGDLAGKGDSDDDGGDKGADTRERPDKRVRKASAFRVIPACGGWHPAVVPLSRTRCLLMVLCGATLVSLRRHRD